MNTEYERPLLGDPYAYESEALQDGSDLEHRLRAERELAALKPAFELTQTDQVLNLRVPADELLSPELIFSISPTSVLLFILQHTPPSEKKSARRLVRIVSLPVEIDPEHVTATMADGEVVLTLPLARRS